MTKTWFLVPEKWVREMLVAVGSLTNKKLSSEWPQRVSDCNSASAIKREKRKRSAAQLQQRRERDDQQRKAGHVPQSRSPELPPHFLRGTQSTLEGERRYGNGCEGRERR